MQFIDSDTKFIWFSYLSRKIRRNK